MQKSFEKIFLFIAFCMLTLAFVFLDSVKAHASGNATTYGNVNQLATIADATVVGGADVPFSNNGTMSGVIHTAGTTTITVPNSGCYKIDYNASITSGIGACLAVAVNGVVDSSTPITALTATGEVSGSVILELAAGDIVTLRNNSMIPLTLALAPSVGAQMNITEVTGTYGYGYELATIADATVVGGADIRFSNNGPMSGISHTAGTTTITVPNSGCYKVNYNASITAGVGAQLAVAVNGTVNASTPITALIATGEVSGSVILQLAAGDIVTLRNNSMIPLTLALAPSVGAQMSITEVTGTYGYGYELATIADATVVGGADIRFSNNGPMSGISHTAGTTTITVPNSGCYKVNYNANITAGVGAQLAVAVNGVVDSSTPITALTATGEVSGSVILEFAAGDVVTLRNYSPVPITLTLAPSVGAQMQLNLIPVEVTASGMTVNIAPKSIPEAEKVMLTVSPAASDANHKVYYRIVDTDPTAPNVGDVITPGSWTEVTDTNANEIIAADGKYVEVVEVTTTDNKVTKWGKSTTTDDGYILPTVFTITAGEGLVRIMTGKPQYANAKIPFVIDSESFSQNPTGYSFDVIYDPTKVGNVTVDSFNGLTKPTIGTPELVADSSKEKVTVSWNGTLTGDYTSSKGILFKLNFVAKQDFTSGETPIEIGTGSVTFASGTSSITGTPGKIISGIIYGDVNGDGAITSSDTNLINKYVSGRTSVITGEAKLIAADVDEDGIITSADAKEISNYISGKTSTLKTLFGY